MERFALIQSFEDSVKRKFLNEKNRLFKEILRNSFVRDARLNLRIGFIVYPDWVIEERADDFRKVFEKYNVSLGEFEPTITYSEDNTSMMYYAPLGVITKSHFFFMIGGEVRFVNLINRRIPVECLTIERSSLASDYPVDGFFQLDDNGYNYHPLC